MKLTIKAVFVVVVLAVAVVLVVFHVVDVVFDVLADVVGESRARNNESRRRGGCWSGSLQPGPTDNKDAEATSMLRKVRL